MYKAMSVKGCQEVEGTWFVFTGLPVLRLPREVAALHTLFRMGVVRCSYWNTKYGLGNDGGPASVCVCLMLEGLSLLKQRETGGLQKLITQKRHKEIKLKELILSGAGEMLCFGGC